MSYSTTLLNALMASCGAHAGECLLRSNSEGTFCTISGIEVAGPKCVCYNFDCAGNRIHTKTSTQKKLRRSQQSLNIKSRALLSITTWKNSVKTLYPELTTTLLQSLARALCEWSTKLELCKPTHPAIKRWPLLFAATVLSHMATGGATDKNGTPIVPPNNELAKLEIDHKLYKTFGITCRSMSIAWRKLRDAALDERGVLIPANCFPLRI